MRLLHTADWHLGKRLFGIERLDEAAAVLEEIRQVAARERVDAVLVAGDLLDRRIVEPPVLSVCLRGLERLAEVAPVVAIAGNHDDPAFWVELAPYLAPRITVVAEVHEPARAVVTLPVGGPAGPLHVACLPWVDPGRLGLETGVAAPAARSSYAEAVGNLLADYKQELRTRVTTDGGATVLLAHLMVDRALAGGGERELTLGQGFALAPAALPTVLDYLALGHLHRPQELPDLASLGRYAGSPLALDFADDGQPRSVSVVEIGDGPPSARLIRLEAGRPLVRLRAPLERLAERAAEHRGAWFSCEVEVERVRLDLVHEVRAIVPDALQVQPVYPPDEDLPGRREGPPRSLAEHYADWYASLERPLDPAQARAFADALSAAG